MKYTVCSGVQIILYRSLISKRVRPTDTVWMLCCTGRLSIMHSAQPSVTQPGHSDTNANTEPNRPISIKKICTEFVPLTCQMSLRLFYQKYSGLTRVQQECTQLLLFFAHWVPVVSTYGVLKCQPVLSHVCCSNAPPSPNSIVLMLVIATVLAFLITIPDQLGYVKTFCLTFAT